MAARVSDHGCESDEAVLSLSQAVFRQLESGYTVLRLVDPATHELCDYQLVKLPRQPSETTCFSSGRARSYARGSVTNFRHTSPVDSGDRQQTAPLSQPWGPLHESGLREASSATGFYPLARLPPLSVRSRGDGTPSLFNDSRPSEASIRSFGPTPLRRLFSGLMNRHLDAPGDSSGESASSGTSKHLGLGFSGLCNDDGTPFDGLGSLPRCTSTPQRGYISPTAQGVGAQETLQEPRDALHLPFFASDSRPILHAKFRTPATADVRSASPPGAPVRRPASTRPETSPPVRPEQDDVFLSRPIRVPGSLTQGLMRRASSTRAAKRGGRYGDEGARRASVPVAPTGALCRRGSLSPATSDCVKKRDGCEKPTWRP
ncbi:hypothetical protein OH77DRAFT_1428496 [Trametes cingulata]|nr:hypothetical protein OH77DRAFT_1428496 [Trametes cingulata]